MPKKGKPEVWFMVTAQQIGSLEHLRPVNQEVKNRTMVADTLWDLWAAGWWEEIENGLPMTIVITRMED